MAKDDIGKDRTKDLFMTTILGHAIEAFENGETLAPEKVIDAQNPAKQADVAAYNDAVETFLTLLSPRSV